MAREIKKGFNAQVIAPVPELAAGTCHVGYTYRLEETRLGPSDILQFRVSGSPFYVPGSPPDSEGARAVCPHWFDAHDDRFLIGPETHEMGVDKVLDLKTNKVATVDSWVGPRFHAGAVEMVQVSRPFDHGRAKRDPSYSATYATGETVDPDERYRRDSETGGKPWVPMEDNFQWLPKGIKYNPETLELAKDHGQAALTSTDG